MEGRMELDMYKGPRSDKPRRHGKMNKRSDQFRAKRTFDYLLIISCILFGTYMHTLISCDFMLVLR